MSKPTVFISYSHKDEKWKDRLVTHLGVLHRQGLLKVWDDSRIDDGDDWEPEIEKAMNAASAAILLVTADFLNSRFILTEEIPRLLQRRTTEGVRIFPVIVKPCAWEAVDWLARMKVQPKDGRPLSGGDENQIDTDLADLAIKIHKLLKRTPVVMSGGAVAFGPDKISTARLPATSPDLFGREKELALLNAAWDDPKTNAVTLVAFGGVGKTALVNKWLLGMGKDHYRGAERVYGWSFYSQGAAAGKQASADEFIAAALTWFGDPDPTKGSPWDKGERLAELVKQQRTLLILDGLEPLQYPPGPVGTVGRIKDAALQALVRELGRHNPGLCVVSSRLVVDDLEDLVGTSVRHVDLELLSPEAGAELLRTLGVNGTDKERRQAAKDFGHHALALTLVGRYLVTVHHGEIRERDKIADLSIEPKQGGHARRVMESYERWFQGKPELDILRVLGLFDRPADGGAVATLRAEPAIEGLTARLVGLSHEQWRFALAALREARLLADEDEHEPEKLDCHPIVREHFGQKLEHERPDAWQQAHGRLYAHYKALPAKDLPDTLDEMAPLFLAVTHGCYARQYDDAYNEVYRRRIRRGNEYYATRQLGAQGAELAALAGFFEEPWTRPVQDWGEDRRGLLLGNAGAFLRMLGRLAEAAGPMETALVNARERDDWVNAAIRANNLSELHLAMGNVSRASSYARESVKSADRSKDLFERMGERCHLADALHQAGELDEADAVFREAEQIQLRHQPDYPFLYSHQGYQYCDFLLARGKHQEVLKRAAQTLHWATTGRHLGTAPK